MQEQNLVLFFFQCREDNGLEKFVLLVREN